MIIDIIRQKKQIMVTLAVLCIGNAIAAAESDKDNPVGKIVEYLTSIKLGDIEKSKTKEGGLVKAVLGSMSTGDQISPTVWMLLNGLKSGYDGKDEEYNKAIKRSNRAVIDALQIMHSRNPEVYKKEKIVPFVGNYEKFLLYPENKVENVDFLKLTDEEKKTEEKNIKANKVSAKTAMSTYVHVYDSFAGEINRKKGVRYDSLAAIAAAFFVGNITGVLGSDDGESKERRKDKDDGHIEEEDGEY